MAKAIMTKMSGASVEVKVLFDNGCSIHREGFRSVAHLYSFVARTTKALKEEGIRYKRIGFNQELLKEIERTIK